MKADVRMVNDGNHVVPLIPWWAGGLSIGVILILAVALIQPPLARQFPASAATPTIAPRI